MESMINANFLFLSSSEAAIALGVSDARVRQLLADDRIQGHKLGDKQWAISPEEIKKYKNSRRIYNKSEPKP
jgi:excisionase family DNA binding protein